jgi:hypothetical protein
MIPLSWVNSQAPQSFQSQGNFLNYTLANDALCGVGALEGLHRETNLSPRHLVSAHSNSRNGQDFSCDS